MSKATAIADLLTLLQESEGKSKSSAQNDYAETLINIISILIESGAANTTVITPDTINGTGVGSTTIPP